MYPVISSITSSVNGVCIMGYHGWIAINETARELPTKHVETQRKDEEETNNLQVLKQSYQASSGYGAPDSSSEDI